MEPGNEDLVDVVVDAPKSKRPFHRDLLEAGISCIQDFGKAGENISEFVGQASKMPAAIAVMHTAQTVLATRAKPDALKNGAASIMLSEMWHEVYCANIFVQFGANVLNLTHGLAAGLLLTEPVEGELKLPFPAFIMLLPEGVLPFHSSKGPGWTKYIIVDWFKVYDPQRNVEERIRWTLLHESGGALYNQQRPNELDKIEGGWNFDKFLKGEDPVSDQDQNALRVAIHLVKNFCAWLNDTGGMQRQRKEFQRRPTTRVSSSNENADRSASVWVVGREVKLSKEMRQAATETALGKEFSRAPGWHVRKQFVVRGHWRNQAHGVNHSLRKRMWIQPYWKGPEDAEVWTHLYQAEAT